MPKMTKQYNMSELVLNRTIGVEMEGYVSTYPYDMEFEDTNPVKSDGSLRYQNWDESNEWNGVEITTVPLRDLSKLETLFTSMEGYGWNPVLDENAGTHIHVDVSDFSSADLARLLWFGKQIENVMFMFVKKYRRSGGWCHYLNRVFENGFLLDENMWRGVDIKYDDCYEINHGGETYYLENGKYTWMNVLSTEYSTVEFRLFHAIENKEELVRFAYLAHNLVELVKNSTVSQLEFIIQSLKTLDDSRQVGDTFCRALGLNFRLPLRSRSGQRKLEREWNLPVHQQRQNEQQQQAV